jgi:hypothetical protein
MKESNIRISKKDRKTLRHMAKKDGRTLKVMFGIVVNNYFKSYYQAHPKK